MDDIYCQRISTSQKLGRRQCYIARRRKGVVNAVIIERGWKSARKRNGAGALSVRAIFRV
jgi:hypothetical protein